ncbi:hypothetical protein [Acidovorax sp. HMWF018]|uniref:hypothetical protein n=1 Tax=Acidovorax sp. HMWF018 TaxID=2056855 RepID=UPI0011B1F1C0|nr:hypothetical protein [Acidovorax sp. HMWF018]
MLSLNARNDPAVGRREDFVRPQGPNAVDYKYQTVVIQDSTASQSPTLVISPPGPLLKKALANIGSQQQQK